MHQIDAPKGTIVSFSDLAADEALVFAAENGNEQAFEILVKRHEEMPEAFAQGLLDCEDKDPRGVVKEQDVEA